MVRQLLMARRPGGSCTAAPVARYLGLNRCTSHRRLAGRGQRFSSLLICQRR
jgi:hypothetical protein